jgi:putative phosphoribosyl transferase
MTDGSTALGEVEIDVGAGMITGDLSIPEDAIGVVVFAHGSGSSRHSSRNQRVAATLRDGKLATLLIDLLTPEEEQVDLRTRQLRFDIELLAGRVAAAVDWVRRDERTEQLPVGLFGASTGAAAALLAAARRPETVAAIVSRGGRPDLAGGALAEVRAPTLLIVGGEDHTVIALNEQAEAAMVAEVEVVVVPGATHLFEEPGALKRVAELAGDHFDRHLR